MLRTALRPRWLALLAVVLLAATAMALLGNWQLDRAQQRGREAAERQVAQVRPLAEVLPAQQTFPRAAVGARVRAEGTWDAAGALLVAGRDLDGRTGLWAVAPLVLADGSAVAVVRGWVPDPADPAAAPPPDGARVAVTGRLEPTEPPFPRGPGETSGLPAGQVDRLSLPDLVNRWDRPLVTGFVVLEQVRALDPAGAGATATPTAPGAGPALVPAPPVAAGLDWLNLSYALQWWVFAAFGLFLWWRLVRDEHLRAGPAPAGPAGVGDHGPTRMTTEVQ